MAGTDIADTPLTSGMNEGIERAVLPLPQLGATLNARMRKSSRWGKRYGNSALSVANLGTGTGLNRCIGGGRESGFVIVDDRCCSFDQKAGSWVSPDSTAVSPKLRIPGAASAWIPDTSYFPVPGAAQRQTTTPCGSCYSLGYLWTAIQYIDPQNASDNLVRVVATNPTDQTLVFVQEFAAAAALSGGIVYPKLVAVGNSVVLTYMQNPLSTLTVVARTLTSLSGGFGAATGLSNGNPVYDISPYDGTSFLFAVASGGGGSIIAQRLSTSFVVVNSVLFSDSGGLTNTDTVSIVGSPTQGVFVGYSSHTGATVAARVACYSSPFVSVGTATVTTFDNIRPLLALLPAGSGARVLHSASLSGSGIATYGFFRIRDVFAAGAPGANSEIQVCAYPVSMPFAIGSSVYCWCKTEVAGSGYATLLRLPSPAAFASTGLFISCPVELSVQDYLVSNGQGLTQTDLNGLPPTTQIGTSATYAAVVPTLYAVPSTTIAQGHDFRVLQAKHFTDSAARRSLSAIYADSSTFVPMGALTRIDDRGAVEEGFIHSPALFAITPANGGGLTALGTYYYTAIYKSRTSSGRYEVSAPANPVKITLTGTQANISSGVVGLGMTARPSTQVEIYRTLANGQTFYLLQILDSVSASFGFADTATDASIATQQALYIQVGQTLPNAFPPASRFGAVGGQRVFVGGLMRPDVVQASKLIFGDQAPSFADSDAFRIVLPAPCTGIGWMDVLVMFTVEGIYIASGDGPDDSGNGDFGNLTRMPYALGCIEPRSVVVVDDGCFFQTARGLYLLPRGFGAPVPAGDNVMDELAQSPIITGVATLTKALEQSVVWTCSNAGGTFGCRIVYDLSHKVWSIDNFVDSAGFATGPCGIGAWLNGEVALFAQTITLGLQASNSIYTDPPGNTPIQMTLATGDVRPFGLMSEGVISKIDALAEVRSACTLMITKTTENGAFTSQRVFALAAGDYQIGSLSVTETELGVSELRDAMSLRVQYDETSTTEGLAFVALSIEHEQGQGLKRVSDLSRNT